MLLVENYLNLQVVAIYTVQYRTTVCFVVCKQISLLIKCDTKESTYNNNYSNDD